MEQMRRFDRGRDYEYAFKSKYSDGIDISSILGRNVDAYPDYCATLLDNADEIVLFEAGFLFDDVLVLADVVSQRSEGSLDIYEIKSGSILSDTYLRDAALQYYVISHCREINSFNLVYAADSDDPFTIVNLTEQLIGEVDHVASHVASLKKIALQTEEPNTPTGHHCTEPYACPYQQHCTSGARQLALF